MKRREFLAYTASVALVSPTPSDITPQMEEHFKRATGKLHGGKIVTIEDIRECIPPHVYRVKMDDWVSNG